MQSRSSIASLNPLRHFSRTTTLERIVPEFNRQDLREVIFGNYRIVYLVKDGDVFILRVVHGARDLLALVRREPWDIGS